jgi:uncharacterized protein YjbI with pentapeptide repeats
MADDEGCAYTHDISGDRFEDLEGQRWECPRSSDSGVEYCSFHTPAGHSDQEQLTDRLLDAVHSGTGAVRLIGATLCGLDLDYATVDGPSNHPIDLRDGAIEGSFSAKHATLAHPLQMEGSTFESTVDLEDADLHRRVDFSDATFRDRVSFRMTRFRSWLDLRRVDFHAPVYSRVARFYRGIYGVDATFHDAADFLNTRFDDVANFYRAQFAAGAVFNSSTFVGNAQFIEATVEAPLVGLETETGSPRKKDRSDEETALLLEGVTCERDLRLTEATLGGDVVFTDSTLARDLLVTDLTVTGDGTTTVDCSGTETISGAVSTAGDSIVYDMSDAVVGEIDLVDERFQSLRFQDTTFDGFDFGTYKEELAATDWTLHDTTADRSPAQLENLYLRAKNGAQQIGENKVASEFFRREVKYRRAGHAKRAREATGTDRLRAAGRWVANAILDASSGFGERPSRPIVLSAVLILVFAGLYLLLGVQLPYVGLLGYLTFSVEAFVALIVGEPQTTNTVVSFLVAIEGLVGAFIIALFVFTLTRSLNR